MGRRLILLVFLCLTLVLALLFPKVWERAAGLQESLPPGIDAPRQRLLRVWVVEDTLSASPWLRRQAARMENAYEGVSVYLRTAQAWELTQTGAVLPDLVLFAPGAIRDPEGLFIPLAVEFPLPGGVMRAGRFKQTQYAVPVCLDGYALVYNPALTGAAAATPAPTPLLGIGASPAQTAAPEAAVSFGELQAALAKVPREKTDVCDFQCAAGMPLLLFTALSGGRANLPADAVPKNFADISSGAAYTEFLAGRCRAAVLLSAGLSSLARQKKPFALLALPLPATDRYLAAGILQGGEAELALAYLTALLSDEGQGDLKQSGLFAVSQTVLLYAADPVFGRVEESLRGDAILPNAFSYDGQTLQSLSRSAFSNNGSVFEILESIR